MLKGLHAKPDKHHKCATCRKATATGCEKPMRLESENKEFKTTSKGGGEARVKDIGSAAEKREDLILGF